MDCDKACAPPAARRSAGCASALRPERRTTLTVRFRAARAAQCVDTCSALTDIEDSGKKVFCRCWKSKTFPLCDGSHVAVRWASVCACCCARGSRAVSHPPQHNKATGDNLGPLIVNKAKP
jgi:CDGSH-type Zn-finger protein